MENDLQFMTDLFELLQRDGPDEFAFGIVNSAMIINRPIKFLREATGLSNDISKSVKCSMENGVLHISTFFTARAPGSKSPRDHGIEIVEIAKQYLAEIAVPDIPRILLEEYQGYNTTEGVSVTETVLGGTIRLEVSELEKWDLTDIVSLITELHRREAYYYIDGLGVVSETQAREHYGVKVDGWSVIDQTPLTTTYS